MAISASDRLERELADLRQIKREYEDWHDVIKELASGKQVRIVGKTEPVYVTYVRALRSEYDAAKMDNMRVTAIAVSANELIARLQEYQPSLWRMLDQEALAGDVQKWLTELTSALAVWHLADEKKDQGGGPLV